VQALVKGAEFFPGEMWILMCEDLWIDVKLT
jgi:hypothetical protein